MEQLERGSPSARAGVVAGVVAGAVALGVTEFGAGISGGRSLVVSVGDWVINHAPNGLVRVARGTNSDEVTIVSNFADNTFSTAASAVGRETPAVRAMSVTVCPSVRDEGRHVDFDGTALEMLFERDFEFQKAQAPVIER